MITNIDYNIKIDTDGRYYSRISFYDNGVRKQRQRGYFDKRKDCVKATEIFVNTLEDDLYDALNFNMVASEYLNQISKKVKMSTLKGYRNCINNILIPYFKHGNMKTFTKRTIVDFHNHLLNKNYSTRTIEKYYTIFVQVFKFAQNYYDLNNNIIDKVEKPKLFKTSAIDYLTLEEFNEFINQVDKESEQNIYTILFYTGMRIGELRALKWCDIDFNKKTININKQMPQVSNTPTTPKTPTSNRIIMFNDVVGNVLESVYNEQSVKPYFTTGCYVIGKINPRSYSSIIANFSRYRKEILKNETFKMRNFRHSHACDLINRLDASLVFIKKRLGHSSIQTTVDIYGDLFDSTEAHYIKQL